MASSSMIMLSNVSMERLYLSQPPAWNDLQRLSYSLTQSQQQQSQQDTRSNQQLFRTCYDKLLHHMYDINSSSSLLETAAPAAGGTSTTTINQINEQLELAAEYCQLKTYRDGNTVYLHSDQFHLEVRFDPQTHLPISIASCFLNEEPLICTNMLKALNEKQYKLFREHLNGYAHLFTLVAPNLNNDKRIGYMTYKILQQDLERLSKVDLYRKLFEGFQPMFEGLPMNIKLGNDDSVSLRILIVPSNQQYHLPIKSSLFMDEKTNTIQIDSSIKSSTLATGYFALEFDENQPAFICLQIFAQEISRLTSIQTFLSSSSETKTFNYLSKILPKTKSFHQYRWYISHDQPAVSIRQIPFTNVKQLIQILNLIRQQMYLTKYFNYYFDQTFDDQEQMDDEHNEEILIELSLLSSTILSITCAQAQYLSTFLMKMSDIENLPILIHRIEQKEYELNDEKNSLFRLIEKLLQQTSQLTTLSPQKIEPSTRTSPVQEAEVAVVPPKLNRRLSCVPPAKPTWRRATTLRRNQPACLTLTSSSSVSSTSQEKPTDESIVDDEMNQNLSTDDFHGNNDENNTDDDDPFLQFTEQQLQNQQSYHPQFPSRPLLSFRPSTLSRCTSVSSTQSVSTPPIFGLSPSTPYPGGPNNPNGNIFFPLGKQVSVPEYSPVSSPMTLGTLDPQAFLPASSLPQPSNNDPNNKNPQQKKKRRRSEHSADEFIQTMNSDNRSPMQTTKLNTSGNNGGSDSSNIKRGKKPTDKNPQQQQLVRQKSAFKVTDSPTTTLLSQQSVTSPDDSSNELKPLKVVIKRVEGSGNSSNDESQQQAIKQRKKQQQQQLAQQLMGNNGGSMQGQMRKVTTNNSSPSIIVKSESIDMSQLSTDSNNMMSSNDGTQQTPRERPRPSSSLANPSSSLSASNASQPRSAPPQPPIVLKIQRSKVYSGQDQTSSSSSSNPTATATQNTTQTSNNIPSVLKEAIKQRVRALPSGANTPKSQVTSPPTLAAKLTSPSTSTPTNPLAQANPVSALFRIPKKSSSQDITAKPKTEPGTVLINNTNTSPSMSKGPLIPGPGVRPSLPPAQVGSWQSPPTQQPSRFNQNRPRPSWPQQQLQRGRSSVTPPNIPNLNAGHSSMNNFSQQPRSILKKPPSNEGSGSDLLYMPSDMPAFNDSRMNTNFSGVPQNRTTTPTEMYDDNDDDTSPQAQLVIDTSSNQANNVLLPYSMVSGSNTSAGMDNYDSMHENNSMMNSSQQQIADDTFSNLD